ncbi:OmpA family protein [Acidipila sp. EB88]|uniref:OmpA family protein n=1 Tax=Acidipila sp. EB88 TaxID=2305226 RepID=UPI001F45DB04|nr:OmpA family protein [Acidipila sp. EB88]
MTQPVRTASWQGRKLSLIGLAALLAVAGCHKKASPPPPPPPVMSAPAPTADITATPAAINAGDSTILTWHTTGATDVSIEGMGAVATSGTQTVRPTDSTNYHLVARGDGGTADATARVTIGTGNNNNANSGRMNEGDIDDATFHQNVKDIFFDYDSYEVNAPSASVVSQDAAYLNQHAGVKIVLGGYCDDRGSTEYNLALGENRANAAKQALVAAGVPAERIRTVSYGKEKQFCSEHDESCYQQNRRAQFTVDR